MYHNTAFKLGPSKTPKCLKIILLLTAGFSIISALMIPLHWSIMPHFLLNLSLDGIKTGFVWQFVSYLFMVPGYKITGSFVIHLAFNIYLIWIVGTAIIERKGVKSFLTLFFSSGIFCAVVALFIMYFGYPGYILGGNSIILYTLLISWMMLYPNLKLLLFFAIPVMAKYLILVILGFNLLTDLSNGDLVSCGTYLAAALYSYFYCLIFWKTSSPFHKLSYFEHKVKGFSIKRKKQRSKIFDFKTGREVKSDEEFVDAMLAKISKEGKDSLSEKEKKRLNKISKKKEK
jgi:membrane associated rhomboid family serine protease